MMVLSMAVPSSVFSQDEFAGGRVANASTFDDAPRKTKKPKGRHLSRPSLPFWGPLAVILDFAGGAALQAVSDARLVFRLQSIWTCYYRRYMFKIYLLKSFKSVE